MKNIVKKLIVYLTATAVLFAPLSSISGNNKSSSESAKDGIRTSLLNESYTGFDSAMHDGAYIVPTTPYITKPAGDVPETSETEMMERYQRPPSMSQLEYEARTLELDKSEAEAENRITDRKNLANKSMKITEAKIQAPADELLAVSPKPVADPTVDRDKYPVAPFNLDTEARENISINTGGLMYKEVDAVIPGKNGLDLVIGVKYDSSRAENEDMEMWSGYWSWDEDLYPNGMNLLSKIAFGWTFLFSSMEFVNDKIYFILADGRSYMFDEYSGMGQLVGNSNISVTAWKEKTSEFSYDGRKSRYNLSYSDGRTEYFDAAGFLIGIRNRYGNTISFRYGIEGNYNSYVQITDTYGKLTMISVAGDIVTVTLPDNKTIKYGVDHWLNYKIDINGARTIYEHEGVEHFFNTSTRPIATTMANFSSAVSSSILQSSRWYFNSNLVAIQYPTGMRTEYTYYTASSSHVHKNSFIYSTITHDNYKRSSHFAALGARGYQSVAAIKERKDVGPDKKVYNHRVYTYSDGSSSHYSGDFNSNGTLSIPSTYTYTTQVQDLSSGITTYYELDKNHNKKLEKQSYGNGTVFYQEANSNFFSVMGDKVYTSMPKKVVKTENGSVTTDSFEYDSFLNVISYKTAIPGKSDYTVTASYSGDLLNERKYLQENGIEVREKNTISNGKITKSEVFEGNILKKRSDFEYEADGRLKSQWDYKDQIASVKTSYTYQETSFERTVDISKDGITEKYVYDKRGRLVQFKDGRGNVTRYSYTHGSNNVGLYMITKTNPDESKYVTFFYTRFNELLQVNEVENQISYMYTPYGAISEILEFGPELNEYEEPAAVRTKTFDYYNDMRLKSETEIRGFETRYEYDQQKRLSSKAVSQGSDTLYQEGYSYANSGSEGNIVKSITKTVSGDTYSPDIKTVSYYDCLDRLTREAFMEGSSVAVNANTYQYNYTGSLIQERSALDQSKNLPFTAKYTVDFEGNVLTETNQENGIVSFTYDMLGRMKSQTDRMNRTTLYEYYDRNLLKSESTPFEGQYYSVKSYEYDNSGNLRKTEASNNKPGSSQTVNVIEYVYNPRNWVISVYSDSIYKAPNSLAYFNVQDYKYDQAGHLLERSIRKEQGFNTSRYDYDLRGRLKEVTDPLMQKETYTYDLASNIRTF